MALPRVKVVNQTESCMGTACYIDGKQIHGVRSVDFRVAVDEVPTFTFETLGLPEIDMPGTVQFSFTPETVQRAASILKHEFDESHIKKELGDCLWMVAEACTALDFNMDDVMNTNIEKLKARFPEGFDVDKDLNRAEGDV